MKLLIFLLIFISKVESLSQPVVATAYRRKIKAITTETSADGTTITYKGDGKVTIANGLLALGKKKIIFDEGITEIEDGAFYQVNPPAIGDTFAYEEIQFPKSLVSIGKLAFTSANSKLTKVSFKDYDPNAQTSETDLENTYALRTIGTGAFFNDKLLSDCSIPPTFTSVEDEVFAGTQITQMKLNSKVTKIGSNGFKDCTKLTEITLPSGVNEIGAFAFQNCTSLKTVTWTNPTSCSFGTEAFMNCASLQEFTFPQSAHLDPLGGIFKDCSSLQKCTMPTTLTKNNTIDSTTIMMFTNCVNLKECTIPTNLKTIGSQMFKNTSIEEMYLPPSVNFIDFEAFKDCKNLKYVNVSSTDPVNLGLEVFQNTPNLNILSIHGDLKADMGAGMFGGKKLCYYGTSNPLALETALNKADTKIYVTQEFKDAHNTFGEVNNGFQGFPCEVMTGDVCSLPGEYESETPSETLEISETLSISQTVEPSESSDSIDSDISGNDSNNSGNDSDNSGNDSDNSENESNSSDNESVKDRDANDDKDKKKKKKLSNGAIAGIVIGCVAAVALVVLAVVLCMRKKKKDDAISDKGSKRDSSIDLKKTPSKKGYDSIDNIKMKDQENPNESAIVV